ncbi:MAG: Zn-ribbon domain-containing OB-fold protein [Actinobacteria bacterium]|nr:Zn-ribbon domain-containing OB-fold protein [Actinomycetota bacterium]MBU1945086.1 Zn-ribbon domain-containing OB-fold protein [Actinomycetota bacterium]MBU2688355.1 Zn-ribbon domain-containing OB-fold protein [Actinomycetota bacterium]
MTGVDTGRETSHLGGRLITGPDGDPRLIGIRCLDCGTGAFPATDYCPGCGSGSLEDLPLPRAGTVWTYTVVYMGGYGSIVADPPYATAFIELDDGTFVHAPITGCDPESVRVGMEVALTTVEAKENDLGITLTYAFEPAVGRERGVGS